MYRTFGGAALLAFSFGASAAPQSTTILIPDAYPAGWRTPDPQAVTVIDRQTIELGNARTLSEVLSGQAGLQVTDLYGDGTTTSVDMRGFGAAASSNVLILVDGRRLNNAADIGAPALHRVPLERIERIEILRGSAGTRYGNQAVGGVINIITRDTTLPSASLEAGVGSYDEYRATGGASTALSQALSLRVFADYRETDNYRDHNNLRADNLELGLDYRYETGHLVAEVSRSSDDLENPGSLFADELAADRRQSAAVYAEDFTESEAVIGRLGLSHRLTDRWTLEGDLNWREEDRDFVTSFRTFPGSLSRQDRRTWRFTPTLVGRGDGENDWDLSVGLDLERTDYKLDSAFGIQAMDQALDGVFIDGSLPLGHTSRLNAGLRHTRVRNDIDNDGDNVSLPDEITVGTLGIETRPARDWRIFARADQNFRIAAVDEHTNIVWGQPVGLENQTGISYEAGIERWTPSFDLRVTAYRLELDNEISFNADSFTNTNLDETLRRGFTAEGGWRLAGGWQIGAQYTFTDAEITAGPFDGKEVPLVAEHSARVFGEGRFGERLSGTAEWVYTGEQRLGGDYNNDFAPLDATSVVNAALTYDVQGWRIRGRVDNLFNEIHESSGAVGYDENFNRQAAFFPAPERRFSLTLRYDF